MEYQYILVEKKGGIGRITLNRPDKLNAWMAEMREEIGAALESLGADSSVRTVIVTGAGRAFCAGHDRDTVLDDISLAERREADCHSIRRIVTALTTMEKPVIAMVNGAATGGGAALALWCDLIIASEDANIGLGFVRLGLGPIWGVAYLLPRVVGIAKAKELLFRGSLMNAHEAEKLGLINKVVPADKLEEETMALAKELAQAATKTIGIAKKLINQGLAENLSSHLYYEAVMEVECSKLEDLKEGLKAFVEKRKPEFPGK
ncbi:enoyl-CoA hydratase/isomerase family protein [Chloroflexota bacterium]